MVIQGRGQFQVRIRGMELHVRGQQMIMTNIPLITPQSILSPVLYHALVSVFFLSILRYFLFSSCGHHRVPLLFIGLPCLVNSGTFSLWSQSAAHLSFSSQNPPSEIFLTHLHMHEFFFFFFLIISEVSQDRSNLWSR